MANEPTRSRNLFAQPGPRRPLTSQDIADLERSLEADEGEQFDAALRKGDHNDLIAELAGRLAVLSAELQAEQVPSIEALTWIVDRPTTLLSFVQSSAWRLAEDGRRHLKRRVARTAAQISIATERFNNLMFRDALMCVLRFVAVPNKEIAIPDAQRLLIWEAISSAYLRRLEDSYVAAGHNPIFAWEAYGMARDLGLPLPNWVAAYLDRCATNISQAIARPGSRSGKVVPDLFGFSSSGNKPGAALGAAHRRLRDENIFIYLYTRRNNKGNWSGATMKTACERFFLTPDAMRTAYDAVGDQLGLPRLRAGS